MQTIGQLFELEIKDKIIGPDIELAQAVQYMAAHALPCLLVKAEGGRAVGVLSERDIALAIVKGKTMKTRVADVMSLDVIAVKERDTADHALALIVEHDVRYLTVMSEFGEILDFLPAMAVIRKACGLR